MGFEEKMRALRAILALATAAILPACMDGSSDGGGGSEKPGTIQFDSNAYSFNESLPVYILSLDMILPPYATVTRSGGTTGAVSVMVSVTGGTAIEGVDYDFPVPGPLAGQVVSWGDGESGPRYVLLTPIDDKEVELTETVTLELTNVTGGATLGAVAKTIVSILDDDGGAIVGPTRP